MKTITIGEIREKIAAQVEAANKRKLELLSRPKAELAFSNAKAEFEASLAESNELAVSVKKKTDAHESLTADIAGIRERLAAATPEALGPWTAELQATLKKLDAAAEELKIARDAFDRDSESLKKKQNELATQMAAARGTLALHDRIDSEIRHLQSLLKPLSGASSSKKSLLDLSPNKKLALGPTTEAGNMYIAKAEIGARVDGSFTEWIGVVLAPSGDVVDWMPLKAD